MKNFPEGFESPATEIINRIILSLSGHQKTGKTHWALTAPGPIALFNLDQGLEGVIEKFADKSIGVFNLELPEELGSHSLEDTKDKKKVVMDMKNQAIEEVKKFEGAFIKALLSDTIQTIVIDTNTELWGLYRIAEFGKTTQIPGHLYNYLNAKYKRKLSSVKKTNKNLILLHHMREEYAGKESTGRWIPDQQKQIPGFVQANLIAVREGEKLKNSIPGQPNPPFSVTVEDSRKNPDLLNMAFMGPLCNFNMVASMITGTNWT